MMRDASPDASRISSSSGRGMGVTTAVFCTMISTKQDGQAAFGLVVKDWRFHHSMVVIYSWYFMQALYGSIKIIMSTHHSLILAAGTLLVLIACTAPFSPIVPATPAALATLIACDDMTPVPDRGSILPAFTPSYPCELESASNHVDFCMVYASSELSYPCSQTESIHEIAIGEGSHTLLIQRDYHVSTGCWHGITSDVRSLRACESGSGESTTLVEEVIGDPILSPDGAWLAFVAAESGNHRLKPHIFRVRLYGTDLIQLDTRPFPQDQVVGAQILQWSEDGEWLEVSLWDGGEGSYHRYHIRSDSSGEFEILP